MKRKIVKNIANIIVSLAVIVTSGVASTGCFLFMYQSQLPDEASYLKKYE